MAISALINRKDTSELYIGEADEANLTANDKLENLATIGDVGGSVNEVELNWLDEGKCKIPDEPEYSAISVEQNLLVAEDTKLYGYFKAGTLFKFAFFVNKADGTVLLGRSGSGYISEYNITGNTIGEKMIASYSIQPVGELSTTTTKPGTQGG